MLFFQENMEQAMLVDNNGETDSPFKNLATPSRINKRLLLPSSSSSKRSLFQDANGSRRDVEVASDAESDIGPMSPLALTDRSSCDSSPGRQFISPLATPDKSPVIPLTNWDGSIDNSVRNGSGLISPFSSLKRDTRSARFSPRRILSFSPRSKSSKSSQCTLTESNLTSPELSQEKITNEVVPETPGKESDFDDQQSYVAETPQKEEYSENRLITPLGSVCKNIPIPRIHRRKSLGALDFDECESPKVKSSNLKRHLEDQLSPNKIKCQKIDEISSIPKARAALFKENDKNNSVNEKEKEFTLNAKSFYGSSLDKSSKSLKREWREPHSDVKKRRSLPSYSYLHRRSIKKHKKGEINCGVGHGIRKPKPKRYSMQQTVVKSDKSNDSPNTSLNNSLSKKTESKENMNPHPQQKTSNESTNFQTEVKNNNNEKEIERETIIPYQIKRVNSNKVDPNKKFFKSKPGNNAIVTVNDKIKLKYAADEKDEEHVSKKARLENIKFDTTDLSVDEPAIESSLEQNKVDNILKILEDDWADDDYDTMDTAQSAFSNAVTKAVTPKNSNLLLKNLTMSPASELSNMASSMNIEDIGSPENVQKSKITDTPSKRFYPLFSKGYTSNLTHEELNSKKRKRITAWQLSSKRGSADNQYQIDAGQKMFGATQCNECGIIYHIGDPEDENAHLNYHNSFKTLKFTGWKNERIISEDAFTSSRIILVEPKDSNLYWKKVNEVLEVVDRDLGLSDTKLSFYRDKKIYMYIRDKTILGVLVAEYVKSAFRMIPELMDLNCCTSESTPVKCGVNVVWTAMSHRRQGIATKLVDALRSNYYYGYIMSLEDIAFSTPTPSGKSFAEKYTKTKNFKVYN